MDKKCIINKTNDEKRRETMNNDKKNQQQTYDGKINVYTIYYNKPTKKPLIVMDLNISLIGAGQPAVDCCVPFTEEVFTKLGIYKVEELQGKQIRVKLKDTLATEIGHKTDDKWIKVY